MLILLILIYNILVKKSISVNQLKVLENFNGNNTEIIFKKNYSDAI